MSNSIASILATLLVGACTVTPAPATPYRPAPPPTEVRSEPAPPPESPAPLAPEPRRPAPHEGEMWDSHGWLMLGEHRVDGKVDSDQFNFSQKQGKVSKIMIVVLDGDVDLLEFQVVFVSGDEYDPHAKQFFKEGSRTRAIDLPRTEILRAVRLKYSNMGQGHARVQVWAR